MKLAGFSAMQLRKLQKDDIDIDVDGFQLRFVKAPGWRTPLLRGGEGFATAVTTRPRDESDDWSSMFILKGFDHRNRQRHQRSAFLCELKLHDLPLDVPLFHGAPAQVFNHVLEHDHLGGTVEVDGYLGHFVEGETFGDLIAGGEIWEPPLEARVALASQLCDVVTLLESVSLVHGDLAPNNLMVADHRSAAPELRIIDFDGFYHADVPVLPADEGRTWGSDGYRARAFTWGDPDSVPTSDRIALAALVFEIITRCHEDMPRDGQYVHQKFIDDGQTGVDEEVRTRWAEGEALLSTAVSVLDPRNAPTPLAWREAIRVLTHSDASAPVSRRQGHHAAVIVRVQLLHHEPRIVRLALPSGTFHDAGEELSWLSYTVRPPSEPGCLVLSGKVPEHMFFVRRGADEAVRGEDMFRRNATIEQLPIAVGSIMQFDDLSITLEALP